jgi:hypothetical protein
LSLYRNDYGDFSSGRLVLTSKASSIKLPSKVTGRLSDGGKSIGLQSYAAAMRRVSATSGLPMMIIDETNNRIGALQEHGGFAILATSL